MKRSIPSRLLSWLLILTMVFSMVPVSALAAEGTATYTQITTADELTTGQYVLVADHGYAPTVLDGSWVLAEAVTATDGVITNPAANLVWTLTVDGSTVKLTDSNGVTISPKTGNSNGIQTGDYSWAVTCTDGTFRFAGQGNDTTVLASNKGSENKFRAYKTGTVSGNPTNYPSNFTLYKLAKGETPVEPDVPETSTPTSEPEVTVSAIADALAGAEGASFTVKGVVTLVDGSNIYVQDATGGICVRMSSAPSDLALGDTIIGTGSRATYNGLPQLGSGTYEKSSGLTLTPKETTIGALTSADICTYISLKGVEVTEVYDKSGQYSSPNITVTDGTNTIQLYKAVVGKTDGTNWDVQVGDVIDILAAVSVYNTTFQLRNTLATEITVAEDTDPTDPPATEPEEPTVPAGTVATLVTSTEDLVSGAEYILVAPSKSAVMGPSAGNYYASVTDGFTLSDDLSTAYFAEDKTQILILGAGASDNTWSFNASGVYLAAVSGTSNHLKNETAVSAFSSWTVEITEDGNATIKSTGDTGKNWIRYNASSPRFSCYSSGQADIAIYKVQRAQYAKLNNTIADGDQFVIYYNNDSLVMSDTANGNKLTGIAATPTDDFILVEDGMSVLTASVDANGYYTFTNEDGKYLTTGSTGNNLTFADAASDYSLWTIKAVDGGVHIVSVNAAYNGNAQALEIYNGLFTTFSEKDTAYYLFNLYKLTNGTPDTSSDLPAAGDQVVIYNQNAEGVLAAENDTQSIESAATEIVDGKAVPANGGVVFTVEVNGNYYRFYNETYGYLCSNGTGNNAFYTQEASDDADWILLEGKSGGYNLESRTAKFNDKYSQYLEYYADSYKTYSMYNVTDYSIYEFFFYEVASDVNVTGGIVNNPAVDFGTVYDAYVGADYTFSFTVDAVFGVDGDLTVTANQATLTPNEDGSYTIPAELITGESLTITVSGVDTKGVSISGSVTVTVKDEPVIGDVTPEANTETKEDKRPVISAVIVNAGENADITMTVNDEAVDAVYNAETGILSYTASADMADGRTVVTVTVKRADGKETAKTWAFTVGKAQYQLYFGQLHSHTTYSDGSGSLESALDYIASLPESANVDFVAFTDHSNYFDASGAANPEAALYDMTLGTANSQKLWDEYVGAMKAFNAKQGNVIAVPGFEMTWSGGPGHINTFNTPGIVSRNNTTLNNKTSDAGMKAYYALLSQPEGIDSISQFNHPGSTFGTFTDFAYWDALIDTRIQLVEVGNGEGQIGAGGYYPSYEYYTMALDKGWHVAPTNNQDNHKGKWGNANDARDVIITDNFSEEGIYEAIRAMRMYATEDKNLEIGYTVNGKMMGSIITEVPEKLTIDVTVYDPDGSDSISKVELIVNSGKVAYTWSNPSDLADGALSAELAPDYSYYYLRVTEGDGDLAVTAPVWVGESLKLGISSVVSGTSTPVTDEELTITTTLFNSESKNATIKSMVYSVDGKVIATDSEAGSIPASGTATVTFKYTPTAAKVQKLTVTAVVELDGKEYTFNMDVTLDVQDASKLVYIGIDASHYNEYVNGNYKDSMGNFSQLAAGYNIRTVTLKTSEDLIAACGNEKYKALILTAPSRRSAEAQASNPLKVYTAEELEAIKAFNEKGGVVILAGWSDHYENYPDVASIAGMKAEEHMAATQNAVLEALGSSLRIGDDATYDDKYNGGQAYRLYFNTYNFDNALVEGVEVDADHPHDRMYTEVFSHYGGASVYTVDGTLSATVSPVVFGHSGTYSVDVDKDGLGGDSMPKYEYAEGDSRLMIMATEQLSGRGLIIVSGAAFMSNFEVQATIEDSGSEKNYSNYKICENLCEMINPVQATPIEEVRAQTEAGFKYTIEGIVTSNASGYDKDTAFFDCIYVQDETGGICCFPVAGNYKIGDKVRITGTTEFYQGEPELQVTSIEVIGEGTVEATEITASQLNDRSAEGKLVTISGTVESFELANGLVQTIMVKDAEGNVARIFIDGYITTAEDVQNLEVGYNITATGLASYDDTFNAPEGPFQRIRIRNRADIICTEPKHDCETAGHLWSEWETTVEATCTEDGSEVRTCGACGETETNVIPAAGHAWSEWETVTDATCTEDGSEIRTCGTCGETETNVIPAHGHNVVLKESKEPTCDTNGYEYYACEHCGGEEYQIILEATGHDYVDGSCTACGKEDPDANKPSGGNWIGKLIGKWFDKWFGGNDKPSEPSEPTTPPTEPSEPEKPSKPGFGSIFDWFFRW